MYLEVSEIKRLHFEFTSLCNAQCPMCPRTANKYLPMDSVTLANVKEWFSPTFVSQLDHMYSCGNYGDPIVNPDCLDIVRYFKENGCKLVSLFTNGGVRDKDFWKELGRLNTRVVFAIDGLEDTNHIYRVGVRWKRLMENVSAFIDAGGIAVWAYLIFKHNEHQVAKAKELSESMGFQEFKVKASSRFVSRENPVETTEVKNKNGENIYKSKSTERYHEEINKAIKTYGSWEEYLRTTPITCKTKKDKSLYVDFNGTVWPCCWSGHVYDKNSPTLETLGSIENNSLKTNTLEYILNNTWLKRLPDMWNSTDRLDICSETCGDTFNPAHYK